MNNSERKRLIQKLVSDSSLDPLSRRLKIGAIISSAFKEDGFDIIDVNDFSAYSININKINAGIPNLSENFSANTHNKITSAIPRIITVM